MAVSVQLAGAKAQVLTYLTTLEKQVEVPKSASHQQVIQVVLFRVSEKMRMSMGVRLCGLAGGRRRRHGHAHTRADA